MKNRLRSTIRVAVVLLLSASVPACTLWPAPEEVFAYVNSRQPVTVELGSLPDDLAQSDQLSVYAFYGKTLLVDDLRRASWEPRRPLRDSLEEYNEVLSGSSDVQAELGTTGLPLVLILHNLTTARYLAILEPDGTTARTVAEWLSISDYPADYEIMREAVE
jgi:hypothetical protein